MCHSSGIYTKFIFYDDWNVLVLCLKRVIRVTSPVKRDLQVPKFGSDPVFHERSYK